MTWFVPGRIEVLGKHTDYAGGRSLLAAVDRGVTVNAWPIGGPAFEGVSDNFSEPVTVVSGSEPVLPAGHWGRYLHAVVDRLTSNFGTLRPSRLEVVSTLPLASGMSSSSALVVALALALADANGLRETDAWQANIENSIDLAGYLACIENGMSFKNLAGHRGVGTFGGSEDHTAMLCCEAGHLGQFSFCPIREEAQLPFPDGHALVVAVSGVSAEKTGAARDHYNRASLATREIVQRSNEATGRTDTVIADVVAADHDGGERLMSLVASEPYLSGRLNQFLDESDRIIPEAADALHRHDLVTFGQLVAESQRLSETGLGNQVPQTVALANDARTLGAVAASAFGAGFGGSVWAMLPDADAADFADTWLDRYRTQFPGEDGAASSIVTHPAAPAHRV